MRFPSIRPTAVLGSLLLLAVFCSASAAHARPQYLKLFVDGYPKVAGAAAAKKCALCHKKNDKKTRLPYGKAVEGGLGTKNEKNELKIINALKKAEKATGSKGQTFGQMIQDGKLPE